MRHASCVTRQEEARGGRAEGSRVGCRGSRVERRGEIEIEDEIEIDRGRRGHLLHRSHRSHPSHASHAPGPAAAPDARVVTRDRRGAGGGTRDPGEAARRAAKRRKRMAGGVSRWERWAPPYPQPRGWRKSGRGGLHGRNGQGIRRPLSTKSTSSISSTLGWSVRRLLTAQGWREPRISL